MKKLLPILCLLILVSCSNEVPLDQLVERNGITYEINSQTPFTGSFVNYHENGQLKVRRNFKDGKRDGLSEDFYENGQLNSKENYKEGELNGLREYYNEKGQLKFIQNWKDGKPDSLWEYFDEEGNLTETEEYKNGELIETD